MDNHKLFTQGESAEFCETKLIYGLLLTLSSWLMWNKMSLVQIYIVTKIITLEFASLPGPCQVCVSHLGTAQTPVTIRRYK